MKKSLFLALLILIIISGIIFLISINIQSGFSTPDILILIGLCIIGAATFVSGTKDLVDIVDKLIFRNLSNFRKKDKKELLKYLSDFYVRGLRKYLVVSYIENHLPGIPTIDREKFINELIEVGYLKLKSEKMFITLLGKKYIGIK